MIRSWLVFAMLAGLPAFMPCSAEEKWVPFGPQDGSLSGKTVTTLRLAQGERITLYAGLSNEGMVKADINGSYAEWTKIPLFYNCYELTDIRIRPDDASILYAFEGGG